MNTSLLQRLGGLFQIFKDACAAEERDFANRLGSVDASTPLYDTPRSPCDPRS